MAGELCFDPNVVVHGGCQELGFPGILGHAYSFMYGYDRGKQKELGELTFRADGIMGDRCFGSVMGVIWSLGLGSHSIDVTVRNLGNCVKLHLF